MCLITLGWRIYQAKIENWHQIWPLFEGNFKGFRVQIEILAAIPNQISKQLLNLLLFLSDWYCRKLELMNLPGHDEKVTLVDRKWFITHKKGITVEIQIITAIFHWFCDWWICNCFCKIDIGKNGDWQIYRVMTGKWRQTRKWFVTHIKGVRVEIEIIAAIFQWFLKQQGNC